MPWCEENGVECEVEAAEEEATTTGRPTRRCKDFMRRTLDSWNCNRRAIGKAEWTRGETNPRFIVTSLELWHSARWRWAQATPLSGPPSTISRRCIKRSAGC